MLSEYEKCLTLNNHSVKLVTFSFTRSLPQSNPCISYLPNVHFCGGKFILLLKYMTEWHFQCYTLARVVSRLRETNSLVFSGYRIIHCGADE